MPDLIDRVAASMAWLDDPGTSRRQSPGPTRVHGPTARAGDADGGAPAPVGGPAPTYQRRHAEALVARALAAGLTPVCQDESGYPALLALIPDPPALVWVRGQLPLDMPAVALVGSRAATPHGLEMAWTLASGLARAGVVIVSGLARGIDAAAHHGAMDGGGRTVAVLGSGVDVIYPPEHRGLADGVTGRGALLSEFCPGTPPRAWHFPRRNRIISGLAVVTVVVEASARSGSLITAARALDQGRGVMVVPGGVLGGRNRGGHALLKDGAGVVESVEDILDEVYGVGLFAGPDTSPVRPAPPDSVLRAMRPGEPCDVVFLSRVTGLDASQVLGRLAALELDGWVNRAGGGRFVRAGANVLR